MSKRLNGKVIFKDLGTGSWGIVDEEGREWRLINMPEQLKKEGARVSVVVRPVGNEVSMFMWGQPAMVISFQTLSPA